MQSSVFQYGHYVQQLVKWPESCPTGRPEAGQGASESELVHASLYYQFPQAVIKTSDGCGSSSGLDVALALAALAKRSVCQLQGDTERWSSKKSNNRWKEIPSHIGLGNLAWYVPDIEKDNRHVWPHSILNVAMFSMALIFT